MSTPTNLPENVAGKLFFVTGSNRGREVFLGESVEGSRGDRILLEGKVLSMTPNGRMVVRPFTTTLNVSIEDPDTSIHQLSNSRVSKEAASLLELSATHVHRSAAPFVYAWVETALQPSMDAARSATTVIPAPRRAGVGTQLSGATGPFYAFYESFVGATDEFRRVLFQTRQIESTRELDQVSELEGDLLIEIGKITNRAAVKINALVQREHELANHLEAYRPLSAPIHNSSATMSGWPHLFERMQVAKIWARRRGRTELVRAINALIKDAVFGLNEVILDHGNSLDTMITETFGQYGIEHDLEFELTPVMGSTWGGHSRSDELAGAGVPFGVGH